MQNAANFAKNSRIIDRKQRFLMKNMRFCSPPLEGLGEAFVFCSPPSEGPGEAPIFFAENSDFRQKIRVDVRNLLILLDNLWAKVRNAS